MVALMWQCEAANNGQGAAVKPLVLFRNMPSFARSLYG